MTPRDGSRYLHVSLYGEDVGTLVSRNGNCRFVARDSFMAAAGMPVLSLSLSVPGAPEIGAGIFANPYHPALYNTDGRLPPFFAGLLPESELRTRLEATRHDPNDRDDFGVLAAAGEDLPGAVVIVPAAPSHAVDARALAFEAAGEPDPAPAAPIEGAAPGAASISGVQNKLALSRMRAGGRYTLPGRGRLSDVIAKLPARNDDSQVFNEYVAMQLARAAGVDVARCEPMALSSIAIDGIEESAGSAAHFLAVQRYDRDGDGRVHVEDACQMLGRMPQAKYGDAAAFRSFLRLLNQLSTVGIQEMRQFFIRQAVNTLVGNSDAHLKNFSVMYADRIHPTLTPAYDIVCVAALPAFQGYGVNVAIDAMQRKQTLDDFKAMARAAGVSERIAVSAVRTAVQAAQDQWPTLLQSLPAPDAMKCIVLQRLQTLPLAQC